MDGWMCGWHARANIQSRRASQSDLRRQLEPLARLSAGGDASLWSHSELQIKSSLSQVKSRQVTSSHVKSRQVTSRVT